MAVAGGGGTLVLNLWREVTSFKWHSELSELGFVLHRVSDWAELLGFSRDFVRRVWGASGGERR